MAINISLPARSEVDPASQPIPRTFVGFDPRLSDDMLWDANRGAYEIDEHAAQEQFATFSHDGSIRMVAELEGVENVVEHGEVRQALLGRILRAGDPVRDALVGRAVPPSLPQVSLVDTAELDAMPAHERYQANSRTRRVFLLTLDPQQWFWSPDDELDVIRHTAAGASVREVWSAGGRRQGFEPGDRVFLLQTGTGRRGVRGVGRVSSPVYRGEHWDDPTRVANFVDIDWDRLLHEDDMIALDHLLEEVSGYGWTPQKGGVELHEPMASEMERLWSVRTGHVLPEQPEQEGWGPGDSRRRAVSAAARTRLRQAFEADGWEVVDTFHDRPHGAVAVRGDQTRYLFGKSIETAGRPVLFTAEEMDFLREHPGQCVLGALGDVDFEGSHVVPGSGVLQVRVVDLEKNPAEPVMYSYSSDLHTPEVL